MLAFTSLLARLSRRQTGQATVVLLATAVAWQLALAGQSAWLCANAARVAARAEAVGRDGRAAALSALPKPFREGLQVSRSGARAVRVRIRMPLLVRRWTAPVAISASAALPKGGP